MNTINRFILFVIVLTVLSACASENKNPERRMGQVLVCHKQKQTVSVSNADYLRHIDHGDSAGPCPYGQ